MEATGNTGTGSASSEQYLVPGTRFRRQACDDDHTIAARFIVYFPSPYTGT